MSTIPASQIVKVIPGVLVAGGNGLDLSGLMLTNSWRVPAGKVYSYPDAASVGATFGLMSEEYRQAQIYFNSYTTATKMPTELLVAQASLAGAAAWLRGGRVSSMMIPELAAKTGDIYITVDGAPRSALAVSLSGATSFTAAAALLETALNTSIPTAASAIGGIAPATATANGSIAGSVLTINSVATGELVSGAALSGTGIAVSTKIVSQLTGVPGGAGTYSVNIPHNLPDVILINASYGVLTVSTVSTGTLSVGQTVGGASPGTVITGLGTGEGTTGTYHVSPSQTLASGSITMKGSPVSVLYDPLSGGFVIRSSVTGVTSSITHASGSLATALSLSEALGALISQGVDPVTNGALMDIMRTQTQNWASFWTTFDPDGGAGNAAKLEFAAWTTKQENRFVYLAWDTDVSPTLSNNAPTSLGAILRERNESGTVALYDPNLIGYAAFVAGYIASLNFEILNGRTTAAFRDQEGLVATVTDGLIAQNLLANGYSFYGAYGTEDDRFVHLYDGAISGQFRWIDSYVNQIWMNNQFQLDLMVLLRAMGSIPYNVDGYAMIEASLQTTIEQAKRFGAIRSGVTLSSTQKVAVNTQAGMNIADTLYSRGWYLQVQNASPQVRQSRGTPPCLFWYCDGQSIQQITLNSIEII